MGNKSSFSSVCKMKNNRKGMTGFFLGLEGERFVSRAERYLGRFPAKEETLAVFHHLANWAMEVTETVTVASHMIAREILQYLQYESQGLDELKLDGCVKRFNSNFSLLYRLSCVAAGEEVKTPTEYAMRNRMIPFNPHISCQLKGPSNGKYDSHLKRGNLGPRSNSSRYLSSREG